MKIHTRRYKIYADRVQFAYLKREIRRSRYMFEQACELCRHAYPKLVTTKDMWIWLKQYQKHYIKDITYSELYAIWEQVQRYQKHLQQGKEERKLFFKCAGMKTLCWRKFPLHACMKLQQEEQTIFIAQPYRIKKMQIWYEKHMVYVEISYLM